MFSSVVAALSLRIVAMQRRSSLVPRPLLDFTLQLWRKIGFSSQLQDKICEWPRNEARGRPLDSTEMADTHL